MWFNRRPKNRRFERSRVLEVKLRSRQVRAARWRLVSMVLGLSLAALAALALVWLGGRVALAKLVFGNPAFALRTIGITTDGSLAPAQLRNWAGVKLGDNLLALDLARVKRDLELVPWIREAAVERILPNTLKIRITEREAVAQVFALRPKTEAARYEPVTFYLDPEGYVMRPRDASGGIGPVDFLPTVTGVAAEKLRAGRRVESSSIHAALGWIHAFEHSPMFGLVEISEIDIAGPDVLRVTSRQGNEITFAVTEPELQLRRWRLVHDYAAKRDKAIATLDLSITNNIPARWMEASAAPSPNPKPNKSLRNRKKHV